MCFQLAKLMLRCVRRHKQLEGVRPQEVEETTIEKTLATTQMTKIGCFIHKQLTYVNVKRNSFI